MKGKRELEDGVAAKMRSEDDEDRLAMVLVVD